jgi:hypothetical protein
VTDTSGGLPPAGWYPDPYGAPHERWWDGQEWTEHTNAAAAPEPVATPAQEAPVNEMPAFAEPTAAQPVYEQPATEQPVYEQPVYEQPVYEQPVYEQPVYEQPTYEQPAYEQPAYEQPAFGQPAYQQPATEQPVFEQPVFEQPVFEQPTFQQPVFEQPVFERPVFEEPTFQQPVFEQPVFDQPAFEQPAYEQPAFDQPATQEPVQQQPAAWPPQSAAEQPHAAAWPPVSEPSQPEPATWGSSPETAAPAAASAAPSYGDLFATPAAGAQAAAAASAPEAAPLAPSAPAAQPFAAATSASAAPDFGQLIAGGDTVDPFGTWAGDDYVEPPRNGAATASLVLGVLSFFLSALAGIFGIVFGAVGLARSGKIARESGAAVGRGKAVAGIVLSLIGSAATVAAAVFLAPTLLSGTPASNGGSPSSPDDATAKTSNGNIALAVGEQGVIKDADGNPAITFTVTAIQPDPTCTAPEEEQLSAENGQFIAVGLQFETSPNYLSVMSTEAPMQLNSADWVGYSPDGTELLNSDAGLSCLTQAEQVPIDIAAGGTTTGTYVLDLATGATSISWAPSDVTSVATDQLRWEWFTVGSQ